MISTPFVELLNKDGEANPFVGVQVRRQTGKEKLCPQTGPRVPDDGLSDGAQDGLFDSQNLQVEEIIEQIVTPFCVELCAEVDKLYSVNQVHEINIVRVSRSLRNLE